MAMHMWETLCFLWKVIIQVNITYASLDFKMVLLKYWISFKKIGMAISPMIKNAISIIKNLFSLIIMPLSLLSSRNSIKLMNIFSDELSIHQAIFGMSLLQRHFIICQCFSIRESILCTTASYLSNISWQHMLGGNAS